MQITLESSDFGNYLIVADDGRDVLIQTDWDYCGVASTFGWSVSSVQVSDQCDGCDDTCDSWQDCERKDIEPCEHPNTDGTVDCKLCGMKAGDFISAAAAWLDENIGMTADDPGYFD